MLSPATPSLRLTIRSLTVLGVLAACVLLPLGNAKAYTYHVIHSFCAKPSCPDGYDPRARLLLDSQGDLFGTTSGGGKLGGGAVFELIPNGNKWQHEIVYSSRQLGLDSPLIMDVSGNLYGTAFEGGKFIYGKAFELLRPAPGGKWKEKVLYNFCAQDFPCPDGRQPEGGLTYVGAASGAPYDGVSPLYGSTDVGGSVSTVGAGTVYELRPKPDGRWGHKVIYVMCSQPTCTDGIHPSVGGMIADASNNLFGTTKAGGVNGQGTVFELVPNAKRIKWSETTLYAFCAQPQCADGAYGRGALLIDGDGSLFGTTLLGGGPCANSSGCGVTFKLVPNGTASTYSVLYRFCALVDCADGLSPSAGLAMDETGTIFGATYAGGGHDIDEFGEGGGTIYSLNGGEQVLHALCAETSCRDGEYPYGGVVMDAGGNIFGTTERGGAYGAGAVYEVSP